MNKTEISKELKQTINNNYKKFTRFIKNNEPGELAETLYTSDAKFYPRMAEWLKEQ